MIESCSIEITPRDELAGAGLRDFFSPGQTVFVSHPATAEPRDIAAACVQLQRAGFAPVPHLAARRLAGFAEAQELAQRVALDAGVEMALVIGGDPDRAAGPFESAFDLLASGAIDPALIGQVAFAGYPEGHTALGTRILDAALERKLAAAQQLGFEPSLVTQFGFDAEAVSRWIAALRSRGIACPVRVGIAGPASVATLARYAVRCGIGASLRALGRGHAAFARILAEASPDALIDELIRGEAISGPIDGLHIFTFGGIRRTAEWLRCTAAD